MTPAPLHFIAVGSILLKLLLLLSTRKYLPSALLRFLCTLISLAYYLSLSWELYIWSHLTSPGVASAVSLWGLSYWIAQPRLLRPRLDLDALVAVFDGARGRKGSLPPAAGKERPASRRRSRVAGDDRTSTSTQPTHPPLSPYPTVEFGHYTLPSFLHTLTLLLLITYLRTSYPPSAFTRFKSCLRSSTTYDRWDACIVPVFQRECPVYFSYEAMEKTKQCLLIHESDPQRGSVGGCLRPLYERVVTEKEWGGKTPGVEVRDVCTVRLHGMLFPLAVHHTSTDFFT
jgi:hypothetical protein